MTSAALTLLLLFLHVFGLRSEPDAVRPHFTDCVSRNMETFVCRWSAGSFQNLSEPKDLRLFYFNRVLPGASEKNWNECPHYSAERPDECFFNENHTTVWTSYTVQLRSRDRAVLYDEISFSLEDLVQPDPPFGLNWTLMNISLTGSHFDAMLSWRPPATADVETGWIALQYDAQYRQAGAERWEQAGLVKTTHRSLFGLQTNVNYEVRVRCKMLAGKDYGDFSDSVFIHIPSRVSRFPVMALLIFGTLFLVAVLLLVIISQQEKLMFILLPPVPGPKIRGIDPNLLKKGKLRELTSILTGPPELRPELYNDPWVEFIELDIEESNDKLLDVDTSCLMDRSPSSPHSTVFRDDDSGRSSCCEPDLLSEACALPVHQEATAVEQSSAIVPAEGREAAAYTQVGEVGLSGSVLLEKTTIKETNMEEEKGKKQDGVLVNADQRDSSSETKRLAELPECVAQLPAAPVYTVVEGVDIQNNLLLTPTPAPNLTGPKIPATPDGYLTPDLLGSVTP
ncbi:growth hormone receptor-like isoform X2 [Xiphophorus couchianus]|nr:growth hormone receptor-like isoform X2 [Xiphophorus couchianus]XP_027881683.1 growth hormone receptor-like isoform X2 [Xiphophorus couchianus]XP_027881684.1 growth hormone receptor-like isoform X2 [Xiphophorus couchianus]